MLYERISSDNEDKEEDKIIGNHLVNLNKLITNIDNVLVCQTFAQNKYLHMKIEE